MHYLDDRRLSARPRAYSTQCNTMRSNNAHCCRRCFVCSPVGGPRNAWPVFGALAAHYCSGLLSGPTCHRHCPHFQLHSFSAFCLPRHRSRLSVLNLQELCHLGAGLDDCPSLDGNNQHAQRECTSRPTASELQTQMDLADYLPSTLFFSSLRTIANKQTTIAYRFARGYWLRLLS